MKARHLMGLLFGFALGTAMAQGDLLEWTNRKGQTMSARFVKFEGGVVTFQKPDGQVFTYPAADLDLNSQSRLAGLMKNPVATAMPPAYRSRCSAEARAQAFADGGGVAEEEAALERALTWLATKQNADGSFGDEFHSAMTGLAMLAMLGRCEMPGGSALGESVAKGGLYLMETAKTNRGLMWNGETGLHLSYEHAIATHALAELLGMTRGSDREVPGLEATVKRAAEHIVDGQTRTGGWFYGYDSSLEGGDMSLSLWQMGALRAVRRSGIDSERVPRALDRAVSYLGRAQDGEGAYKYRLTDDKGKATLTGGALYQLHRWGEGGSTDFEKGMAYLTQIYANPRPGLSLYTPYFNTQIFHVKGGDPWRNYRTRFIPELLAKQNGDGSFMEPVGTGMITADNQLMNTAWAALILEVYYREPVEPENGGSGSR